MILMALDHIRDFFHDTASLDSPTNLLTTTPVLFFTRWITHFCAPTFLFLSGISAYLLGQKKTKRELSSFLLKRGLWLTLVEVVVITLAWTYNPFYNLLILQVIWTIGISMIILGFFSWLPENLVLIAGLLIICFHNMLDPMEVSRHGKVGLIWDLVHHGNFTPLKLAPDHIILIVYAFLPWTGIMLFGYGIARLFTIRYNSAKRRMILFVLGSAFSALFFVLRSINHYGDPSRWYVQRNGLYSWLSFLNLSKYPPSLDYIALTIGVAMIVLGLLDRISKNSFSFLRVFGRVPFFYYVVHLYFIHALAVILFVVQGYPSEDIAPQRSPFMFRPDHFGFGLPGVYVLWLAVILILYPLCKWFGNYKKTHDKWWLSYM